MKILMVDDDNTKIGRLVALLVDQLEIPRDDLHVAHTVADARRELAAQEFDLLILDILLPTRPGDQLSSQGAVSLLEELSSRRTLRKPRYILGLTAYDEAILEVGAAFIRRTWTIIKFTFESEEWKQQIEACVKYIRSIPENARKPNYETDLCIVTALVTPELDAVIRLPWRWQAPEPIDDITFVRTGEFESAGNKFNVIAAAPTKVGMVSAALLAAKLIIYARPRFVVMTGMCAGVKGKTNFGDVIISDPGWNWQSGKHFVTNSEQGFAMSPDPLPLSHFVRSRAEQLRSDAELIGKIRQRWPAGAPDTELRLRIGPMASGSPVVADFDIIQRIVVQNRNLLGVEMEAYGVLAAAAFASHPRPTAFACKAVCDFGDEEKSDHWQAYASYTSAEIMRSFFEINMRDIRDLAGS
jgi:nucleoside phosphorylase/CheY-like chemotaxis protein